MRPHTEYVNNICALFVIGIILIILANGLYFVGDSETHGLKYWMANGNTDTENSSPLVIRGMFIISGAILVAMGAYKSFKMNYCCAGTMDDKYEATDPHVDLKPVEKLQIK